MLTPKQQLMLERLRATNPDLFKRFDLQVVESPEHKLSIQIANRVETIIANIAKQPISPRTIETPPPVPREMTYHEKIIDMFSRVYICQYDSAGKIICPF